MAQQIMRQYFIVENSEEYDVDYMDYVAGPMNIDQARSYLHTNRQLAKAYNYKIVYQEIITTILNAND